MWAYPKSGFGLCSRLSAFCRKTRDIQAFGHTSSPVSKDRREKRFLRPTPSNPHRQPIGSSGITARRRTGSRSSPSHRIREKIQIRQQIIFHERVLRYGQDKDVCEPRDRDHARPDTLFQPARNHPPRNKKRDL